MREFNLGLSKMNGVIVEVKRTIPLHVVVRYCLHKFKLSAKREPCVLFWTALECSGTAAAAAAADIPIGWFPSHKFFIYTTLSVQTICNATVPYDGTFIGCVDCRFGWHNFITVCSLMLRVNFASISFYVLFFILCLLSSILCIHV